MPHAVEPAVREELRRAGLPGQGMLAHLLELLHGASDTHLSLAEAVRLAADAGLDATPAKLARHLETLVDLGLLGRLPSASAEPVFDTVAEPHSHMMYEETGQVVDLHVSPETLLAIVRQALAERPDRVEILIRVRRGSARGGAGAGSRLPRLDTKRHGTHAEA